MTKLAKAIALAAALAAPATASGPINVFLDGQWIGTHKLIEYDLAADEIHITTNEIVFGCQQSVIHQDSFEGASL